MPSCIVQAPLSFSEGSDPDFSEPFPLGEALLGVVTLEILGLVLNPFTRTLQPMRMLLA